MTLSSILGVVVLVAAVGSILALFGGAAILAARDARRDRRRP